MKTIPSSKRNHYTARVSIFLIMVALIAGMVGFPVNLGLARPFQDGLGIPEVIGAEVTTMAQSSENITTYDGDLIIGGYEEFVIANCTWIQKGNIIIRDYGKLVVNNASLSMEMDYWTQNEIVVENQGSLVVENAKVETNQGFFHTSVNDQAKVLITSSELHLILFLDESSQATVIESTLMSVRMWFGSASATISNSTVGSVYLAFDRNTAGSLENLKSGLYEYWNVHGNNTVTNTQFDLTLENVVVNEWELTLDYSSQWAVSDSDIARVALNLEEISAQIADLNPGFYEALKLGSVTFSDTSIGAWTPTLSENANVTFTNSTIGPILSGTGNLTLVNCTIVFHLWPQGFLGKINFDQTAVTTWIRIEDSAFSISGNVDMKNAEIDLWDASNVTREYGIFVSRPNGDPMENVELRLLDKDQTLVWSGTTDSLGHASFGVTFTADDYTDALRLEAVKGDLSAVQNITVLSDTPVVLTLLAQHSLNVGSSPSGSVTTPGEGTFTYDQGTEVNLVAEPDDGYHFVNWTGDVGTIADVNGATTTITMNDDYSITANFEEVPPLSTGCFIATAAYGTPMAEEVQVLREFRDEYMLTDPLGQAIVDVYYTISPPIAHFITEHPSLKPIVRAGLMPAVDMCSMVLGIVP
jgi:hypothetical protein